MCKKIVLSILLTPALIHANVLDSNFFKLYQNDVIIGLYSSTDVFTLRQINQNENTFIFKPNQNLSVGFGFAYRWLVLGLGMTVADMTDNQKYGKSKRFSLGIGATIDKSTLYLNIQNFNGFYIKNYEDLGLSVNSMGQIPNLPNMYMTIINLNYSYFFNGLKFSTTPYTTGNSYMTKTCGSFILSSNLTHFTLKNDSSFVSFIPTIKDDNQIKSIVSIAPYISAGYGQNICISKNLSLILILNAGLGIEKKDYVTNSNKNYSNHLPSARIDGFAGIMYNKTNFFISMTTEPSFINHELVKSNFETNMNRLTINFGYRIKQKGRLNWIGNKIGL